MTARHVHLRDFDDRTPGAYFLTIVTHDRAPLFGALTDGLVSLGQVGRMVEPRWSDAFARFVMAGAVALVVMPDQFHRIISLTPGNGGPSAVALPDRVRWFKSIATADAHRMTNGQLRRL